MRIQNSLSRSSATRDCLPSSINPKPEPSSLSRPRLTGPSCEPPTSRCLHTPCQGETACTLIKTLRPTAWKPRGQAFIDSSRPPKHQVQVHFGLSERHVCSRPRSFEATLTPRRNNLRRSSLKHKPKPLLSASPGYPSQPSNPSGH
ncbi:hypothetical protein EJ04DRAFT_130989 [Polyplosphaeria fusca]|uniref:Uncharacterized protein n=1 Tax=Polyplosphaeria fusca TaxID=682080 RepID=A0A9P4R5N5_9PLEO|nr:hypothetical protein EJ04DRAFT_130989 [Polyplosphaeria fusca]